MQACLWHDIAMLEPPRRIPYATWPGALAVFAAIALYVGGLVLWDSHTPASRPIAPGKILQAGHGARFAPAADWQMNLSASRVGNSVALFKGGSSFTVSTGPWIGGPQGPMLRQRRLMEQALGLHLDSQPEAFFNLWGLQGQTFAYDGPGTTGRYWQIVDAKRQVVVHVDFRGPPGTAQEDLADAKAMVDSMDLQAQ